MRRKSVAHFVDVGDEQDACEVVLDSVDGFVGAVWVDGLEFLSATYAVFATVQPGLHSILPHTSVIRLGKRVICLTRRALE
jgi:hypothetical protein